MFVYEQKIATKKIKNYLQLQYGQKPQNKELDFEKIELYWNEVKDYIPEDEKIDDVTWNDLEMFDVYNRINACCSFAGDQILFRTLHCLPKDDAYGENIEKKIEHFASNQEEREAIQLLLFNIGKDGVSYYLPTFLSNLEAFDIKEIWIYRILQVLFVLPVIPAIIFKNESYFIVSLIVFIFNMTLYGLKKMQYEINLNSLTSILQIVKAGKRMADSNHFSYEKKFGDLQNKVEPFQKLAHIVGRIQRKKQASFSGNLGGILYDYIIGGTLWDFIAYDKVMRVLKEKHDTYLELYEIIGEIDMLISIASFRESLSNYCVPFLCKEHQFQFEELYHPLIEEPVCNSIHIDHNCIITGSNASGKSTFIKALMINILLAQNINTCMAKKMVMPFTQVITSMAVRDNLMSGESYYIKEIKYLNRIIKSLSPERFVICAIDEILRGTNTEERIAASASILSYLNSQNCIVIVASHDIELTQILKNVYKNYHFSETILENDITFDYKIREGASTSKNAIKLLEYVGFPEEIIENAKKGYVY
jgi:Mismatch repair ATPase (MutS family)